MAAKDTQYDIQRLTGKCASSDEALAPGDVYYAVLLDPPLEAREADGATAGQGGLDFIRRDVSEAAWAAGWRTWSASTTSSGGLIFALSGIPSS